MPFERVARTCEMVLLSVDIHLESVLRVRHVFNAIDVHVHFTGFVVTEKFAHLLFASLGGREHTREVAILVRLFALSHLLSNLALHRGRIEHGFIFEHAHEVGNLNLWLGRFDETLPNHLLLFLFASDASLRSKLLLLLLREHERLRRRRWCIEWRLNRHGVFHVHVKLIHLDVPFPILDVVVRTVLQNIRVPPLHLWNVVERRQRASRARTSRRTRALADRNEVRVHRRFAFELFQVSRVALVAILSTLDALGFFFAKLHAKSVHVGFFLKLTILDKLQREKQLWSVKGYT